MPPISGSLCPTDLALTTDSLMKESAFCSFGLFSLQTATKCLYFFLVALYVILELYKFSFPVVFTWPECASGTFSSSQGQNSHLSLVTLTSVVLYLVLLHHQHSSCYLVSSDTLSATATCTFDHLARLFPDLFFPHRHLTRAVLSQAGPAAQPSTVKLEKSCSSWSKSSHLWAMKHLHSPTLWKWGQQNYKSTSVIYLPHFSIFLSPYAKF